MVYIDHSISLPGYALTPLAWCAGNEKADASPAKSYPHLLDPTFVYLYALQPPSMFFTWNPAVGRRFSLAGLLGAGNRGSLPAQRARGKRLCMKGEEDMARQHTPDPRLRNVRIEYAPNAVPISQAIKWFARDIARKMYEERHKKEVKTDG